MGKLIILVTNSDNDYKKLIQAKSKQTVLNNELFYFKCAKDRVLYVVKLSISKKKENTNRVLKVANKYKNYEIVIGTHTRDALPIKVLNIKKINEKLSGLVITNYSTAWSEFEFINQFCQELVNSRPNETNTQKYFDKLFDELKKKHPSDLIKVLSIIKHQIVNILQPLRIDIEALIERNFDVGYWQNLVKTYKTNLNKEFSYIKKLIYQNSDNNKPRTIKDIVSKITDNSIKTNCDEIYKKFEKLLSINQKNFTTEKKVNDLLNSIKKDDKNAFKNLITINGNVYKKWMDELIDLIDQLILELQKNK